MLVYSSYMQTSRGSNAPNLTLNYGENNFMAPCNPINKCTVATNYGQKKRKIMKIWKEFFCLPNSKILLSANLPLTLKSHRNSLKLHFSMGPKKY